MSVETPRVVLLGKSASEQGNEMYDLLTQIEPTHIPNEFLDTVYVTMSDQRRYKVSKRYYETGLDYANIEEYLAKIGSPADMTLIEIVLDLEKASKKVASITTAILDTHLGTSNV